MYMLDTDICSYILRERPLTVLEKFKRIPTLEVAISVVTEAELRYGVARSSSKKMNAPIVDAFLAGLQILSWDSEAAKTYGILRAKLERKGKIIGNLDMMIAAHALSLGATLVSNNHRHFAQVPKLHLVNWV